MRVGTSAAYGVAIGSLQQRQSDLVTLQEQMTSGKRINKASDDPAAAARAERAEAAGARATAAQRGVDASNNAMTLSESALGDASDLLQQAREALVAAGNASYGDSERAGIATKLSELRKQLLDVANRSDGSGNHLFGGQSPRTAPFVDAAGGVQYAGVAGQALAASGESLPVTVDGRAAWMQAASGNGVFEATPQTSNGSAWVDSGSVTDPSRLTGSTYTIHFDVSGPTTTYSVLKDGLATSQNNVAYASGQAIGVDGMSVDISGAPANGDEFQLAPSRPVSVFSVLDKAITDLRTPNRNNGSIRQANTSGLANVDAVLGQIQSSRTQVGETLNRIDGVTGRIGAQKIASESARADAEDLDMTQAISSFSQQQTGYDAALKAYALVQKLSLFNYISS